MICGFGRLGTWFGIERWDVVPDMITFAKGVTSGYLPLGGVIVSDRVAEPFWRAPGGPVFRHGATYAGHATCAAAALANLDDPRARGADPARRASSRSRCTRRCSRVAGHPAAGEVRGGARHARARSTSTASCSRATRARSGAWRAARGAPA